MKIGVLALQGAFIEHIHLLNQLGVDAIDVRLPHQLNEIDGLIIPGGESTTIGKLAVMYGLIEPLRKFAEHRPMCGTCAGMIFMAKEVGREQPLLGVMDIEVEGNALGRQVNSFEIDLYVPLLSEPERPCRAVFIRAPKLIATHEDARPIAQLPDGTWVAAQQGHFIVTAFHPELTHDPRFHQYFMTLVAAKIE